MLGYFDPVIEKLADRFSSLSSFYERQEIWRTLLGSREFQQNWIFGVGPASAFLEVCDNWYLLVLYRYGVVGAGLTGLFMVFIAGTAVMMLQVPERRTLGVLALTALLAFAVSGLAMVPSAVPRIAAVFW